MNAEARIKELIGILNDTCKRYYTGDDIMSDKEYDRTLSELIDLETKTGFIFSNSPSQRVGYSETGRKVVHSKPILSLKSTKIMLDIINFIDKEDAILSWKLDGISIVLYYEGGKLIKALSRGDGKIGKDITKNVILMQNVPLTISAKHILAVRGEGCISINEFDILKKTKEGEKYKNPRSLASGLINSTKTTSLLLKHMVFIAHSIVDMGEWPAIIDYPPWVGAREQQLSYLEDLKFKVVEHYIVNSTNVVQYICEMSGDVSTYPYPVDGLVIAINDEEYSESLGTTAMYPKHSLAFKWTDEVKETRVTGMKWSVSKTGLITPVVIFEPIELEGTYVKQANLHSLKRFDELGIGNGDILRVYKANKIIPEVEENMTRSKTASYPQLCPVCNEPTCIFNSENTKKLYCHKCGNIKP